MKEEKSLSDKSDEELMQEYKLGSTDAFSILYRRHAKKVYGYLYGKLSSKAQAEDVFQETILRLHRYRSRYDTSFPFLPWLFTICKNSLVDYFRKANQLNKGEIEIAELNADLQSNHLEELQVHLEALTTTEGDVIKLHFMSGYSFEEVASYLKIKPSNARKISSRAISKLRSLWK